jgi:hypothetical protein
VKNKAKLRLNFKDFSCSISVGTSDNNLISLPIN